MNEMNYEQKFAAMQALVGSGLSMRMRKPGDWYVKANHREIGGNGMLSGAYGNGRTPQEAIEDDWRQLVTELPDDKYIVIDAMTKERKHFRWNDFMWEELSVTAVT